MCDGSACAVTLARALPVSQLADGSIDAAFGSGGLGTKTLGGSASIWAIAVQPDGKIVLAGASGSTYSLTLVRFDAMGVVDDAFGEHPRNVRCAGVDGHDGRTPRQRLDPRARAGKGLRLDARLVVNRCGIAGCGEEMRVRREPRKRLALRVSADAGREPFPAGLHDDLRQAVLDRLELLRPLEEQRAECAAIGGWMSFVSPPKKFVASCSRIKLRPKVANKTRA